MGALFPVGRTRIISGSTKPNEASGTAWRAKRQAGPGHCNTDGDVTMVTLSIIKFAPESKPLIFGPRTRREIELRIRELSARLHPTIFDLAELARLRELIKSTERAQEAAMISRPA
jgi:hypothetical protein